MSGRQHRRLVQDGRRRCLRPAKRTGGDGGKGGGADARRCSANVGAGAGAAANNGRRCFPRRTVDVQQCGGGTQGRETASGSQKRSVRSVTRAGSPAASGSRMCMSKQAPVRTMQMRKSLLAVTIAVAFSAPMPKVFLRKPPSERAARAARVERHKAGRQQGRGHEFEYADDDRRHGRPGPPAATGGSAAGGSASATGVQTGAINSTGNNQACGGHGQLHHAGLARRTQGPGGRRRSGKRPFRQRQQCPL